MTFMEWISVATKSDVLWTGVAVIVAGTVLGRVSTWWLHK